MCFFIFASKNYVSFCLQKGFAFGNSSFQFQKAVWYCPSLNLTLASILVHHNFSSKTFPPIKQPGLLKRQWESSFQKWCQVST